MLDGRYIFLAGEFGEIRHIAREHDRMPQGKGADTCTPDLYASSRSDSGSHQLSCWSGLRSTLQAEELVMLGLVSASGQFPMADPDTPCSLMRYDTQGMALYQLDNMQDESMI
jgi:hypothetical protein